MISKYTMHTAAPCGHGDKQKHFEELSCNVRVQYSCDIVSLFDRRMLGRIKTVLFLAPAKLHTCVYHTFDLVGTQDRRWIATSGQRPVTCASGNCVLNHASRPLVDHYI